MPRGGKRAGAGRPKGTGHPKMLADGVKAAIRSLRHRVPADASEEAKAMADEALATFVEIMRDGAQPGSRERLSAAKALRDEVCGAVPTKVDVAGKIAATIVVSTGVVRGPPGGDK